MMPIRTGRLVACIIASSVLIAIGPCLAQDQATSSTVSVDDSEYEPSNASDVTGVLLHWMHKHKEFFAVAKELFRSESRTDWSGLMERRVAEVASNTKGMAIEGECRADLCVYAATFDPSVRRDKAFHDFGHQLVNENSDPQTILAMASYDVTGPRSCDIYIFSGQIPASYLKPLGRGLHEHLKTVN